jgi:hypothetical protein
MRKPDGTTSIDALRPSSRASLSLPHLPHTPSSSHSSSLSPASEVGFSDIIRPAALGGMRRKSVLPISLSKRVSANEEEEVESLVSGLEIGDPDDELPVIPPSDEHGSEEESDGEYKPDGRAGGAATPHPTKPTRRSPRKGFKPLSLPVVSRAVSRAPDSGRGVIHVREVVTPASEGGRTALTESARDNRLDALPGKSLTKATEKSRVEGKGRRMSSLT